MSYRHHRSSTCTLLALATLAAASSAKAATLVDFYNNTHPVATVTDFTNALNGLLTADQLTDIQTSTVTGLDVSAGPGDTRGPAPYSGGGITYTSISQTPAGIAYPDVGGGALGDVAVLQNPSWTGQISGLSLLPNTQYVLYAFVETVYGTTSAYTLTYGSTASTLAGVGSAVQPAALTFTTGATPSGSFMIAASAAGGGYAGFAGFALVQSTYSTIQPVTWTGLDGTAPNGTWNAVLANSWNATTGGAAATYVDGSNVTFDDSGITHNNITIDAGGVSPASVVFAHTSGNYTFAGGSINGTGDLTVSGGGTVTFNNNNGYTGQTQVANGTLVINGTIASANVSVTAATGTLTVGATGSLPAGTTLANSGGSINFNNTAQTVASLNQTGGTTTLNGTALTIGTGTIGGTIANGVANGRLITTGSVTLSNANAYTGGTTVQSGVLLAASTASVGNGPVVIQNTGTFRLIPATGAMPTPAAVYTFDNPADSGSTITNDAGPYYAATMVTGSKTAAGLGVNGGTAFNDAGGNLQVPGTIPLGSSYTLSLWFNDAQTGSGPNDYGYTTAFRADAAGYGFHEIATNSSQDLGMYAQGDKFTSAAIPFDTQWHQVTAVCDGTSTVYYLDGTAVGTVAFAAAPTDIFYIGSYNGNQTFANLIDNVYIYQSALTPAQVGSLYSFSQYGLLGTAASQQTLASPVTVNAGGTFDLNGNAVSAPSILGSGSVLLNGGDLTLGGDNSSTTLAAAVTGAGQLTKTGTGTLAIPNAVLGTNIAVIVNQGIVDFASPSAIPTGTAPMQVNKTGSTGAMVIVRNETTSDIVSRLAAGTITTTMNSGAEGVGYLSGSDLNTVQPGNGLGVTSNDVLLKHTYYGDCFLNGTVTAADFAQMDASYLLGITNATWLQGDFNYDGSVTAADYALADLGYAAFTNNGQLAAARIALDTARFGAAFTTAYAADLAAPAAVPEPASLALLATGGLLMLKRRTRR
jgi:autotransporter-associated beta strand protein